MYLTCHITQFASPPNTIIHIKINLYLIAMHSVNLKTLHIYRSPDIDTRLLGYSYGVYNISIISWRSVLLVEETRVPVKTRRPAESH